MKKIKKAIDEGGVPLLIKRILRHLYLKYFRDSMPLRWGSYNGIEAPTARLFEDVLDLGQLNKSSYEKGMISALEEYSKSDDKLIIVGGGVGITAVYASKILEPGKITVYEGSKDYFKRIKKTLEYHNLDEIDVIHTVVETGENLFGDEGDYKIISASDLEKCDLLELDVEGNEIPILKNLEVRPRIVLVESHGVYDSPTEEVESTLEEIGYEVVDIREAEEDEKIQEQDVKIVVGKRE